jgi:uncharacterized protein with beta-barrel porin domain
MKLPKTLFIAAAALATVPFYGAAIQNPTTNLSGAGDSSVPLGVTWVINQDEGTTYTGRWLTALTDFSVYDSYTSLPDEMGTIVLKGSGALEYQGWREALNVTSATSDGGFYSGRVFHAGRHPTLIADPTSPGNSANNVSFTGTLRLAESVSLRVSGYLNQYYAYSFGNSFDWVDGVEGVQRVVLSDSSTLSFQNSPRNIVQTPISDIDAGPYDVRYRFNIVKNVESDGNRTRFVTGPDDTYRIVLHMDYTYNGSRDVNPVTGEVGERNEGGIGYLEGKGHFIKTGSGDFSIKNDGDFTGSVIFQGGVNTLSSPAGAALGEAYTVNLAGSDARSGAIPGVWSPEGALSAPTRNFSIIAPLGEMNPAEVVRQETVPINKKSLYSESGDGILYENRSALADYANYVTVLAVETDQTIRNFQTYFQLNKGPDELYGHNSGAYGTVGTGDGTAVFLSYADPNDQERTSIDRKLTIIQEEGHDGLYRGALVGSYGSVLEKKGLGKLALFSSNADPSYFTGTIDIQEGGIIADGSSLGSGRVNIADGANLTIVQNNSGVIAAVLKANTQGELLVTYKGFITNEDFANVEVVQTGDGQDAGVLQIYKAQPMFHGNVVVEEGVSIYFSARENDPFSPNDAFSNAKSVTLLQGLYAGGRATTLAFADTDQRLNNLSGDPKTRLALGRGTVTLRQTEVLTFGGTISGAGNLILITNENFVLSGSNTYFGATVVKPLDNVTPGVVSRTNLFLGSATGDTVENSSGLVLYEGAHVTSAAFDFETGSPVLDPETALPLFQPQHFGMLFGEKGSSILMGDATLTIGVDSDYLGALADELAKQTDNSPGAQAAYFFNTVDPGEKVKLGSSPLIEDFTAGTSRYYLDKTLEYMTSRKDVKLDASGEPVVLGYDDDGNEIYDYYESPGSGLKNADALAYEGEIIGSGDLVKVGDQRLIFSGESPEFTGNVRIKDGFFRLNADSLPGAGSITVDIYRGAPTARFAEVEFAVWEKEKEFVLNVPVRGEGTLSKIGAGTLFLPNYETTGPTRVKEGVLVIPVLPNLNDIFLGDIDSIEGVALSGTVAFNVAAKENIIYTHSIKEAYPGRGAVGGVEKRGAGKLTLRGSAAQSTNYVVEDGVIAIAEDGAYPYALNYSGATTVLEGELVFEGNTRNAGGSVRANIPGLDGTNTSENNFDIRAAGTLTFDVGVDVPAARINGGISGAGVFQKDGAGVLEIGRQAEFAGDVVVLNGDLSLKTEYAFEYSGVLCIRENGRVLLNNNDQVFQSLSSNEEEGGVLKIDAATVTFNTKDGSEQTYYGLISGSGDIHKYGGGTLTLRGDNTGDFSGRVYVGKGGVLDVTTRALGEATEVAVISGGILRIFSDSTTGPDQFNSPIRDIGVVEKTGPGTVYLAWDAYNPDFALGGTVTVAEGLLIVDSARNNNGLPLAEVKEGAKLQINLQVESLIYGGVGINGVPYEGQISGLGDLIVDGQGGDRIMFIQTRPRYDGVTKIQNHAILNVSGIDELPGGIASDKTSKLDFGDRMRTFYITQSKKDSFSGSFIGNANLEINGAGLLQYLGTGADGEEGNLDSYSGVINIRGGKLQVGIGNKKALDIGKGNTAEGTRDGSLYINVRDNGADSTTDYAGALTSKSGAGGNIIKTGAGDLDTKYLSFLATGSFKVLTLGVDQGRLFVNPDHIFNVQKLAVLDSGRLVWNTARTSSTLEAGKLVGAAGTVFEKTSGDALLLGSQEDFKGDFLVQSGEVQGNFALGGNFTLNNGSSLAPSSAPGSQIGTAKIDGIYRQNMDAVLKIEINGGEYDKLVYGGGAYLNGVIEVKTLATPAARGNIHRFVEKATEASPDAVVGDNAWLQNTDEDFSSNVYYVLVGPNVGIGTAYERFGQDGPGILVAQRELVRVPGYFPHKGLETLLPVLDFFATRVVTRAELTAPEPLRPAATAEEKALHAESVSLYEQTKAMYEIGSYLNTASAAQLGAVINNLSPLAYASLVSLPAAANNAANEQLHARLEERRYDRRLFEDYTFQLYLGAASNFGELGGHGTSDPVYKLRSNGGSIGGDALLGDNTVLGAVVNYANGTATFHDGGGSAKMDSVRATAYLSHIFGSWFYFDGGVSAGISSYDVKRETVAGVNKSKPDAFNTGAFLTLGSVFTLVPRLHLNPYASLEYNHYDTDGFIEDGGASRLSVDSFTHDSLRVRAGSGIAWFIEGLEWVWKVNLDVAFASELLDTDSVLNSQFVVAGGEKTKITSKALAKNAVQISPSVTWSFDERVSVYASYRMEAGFDGEIYNSINLGFRTRF